MTSHLKVPVAIALDKLTESMGISPVTMWKYRREDVIRTCNLHGRIFVTAAEAERFIQRLEAGEFARTKKVPPPPRARRRAQEGAEA